MKPGIDETTKAVGMVVIKQVQEILETKDYQIQRYSVHDTDYFTTHFVDVIIGEIEVDLKLQVKKKIER